MSARGENCKQCRVHFTACVVCGVIFTSRRSDSKTCGKGNALHRRRERRLVDVNCDYCGISFQLAHADVLDRRLQGKPTVCGGKCLSLFRGTKVEFKCAHCGRPTLRYKSEMEKYEFSFCSKECESVSHLHRIAGRDHYRYKDGSTCNDRGPDWTLAKRRARKRDGFACKLCGITERQLGKKLDVHHITAFRLFKSYPAANKIGNLISLCSSCHHRIEAQQVGDFSVTNNLLQMVS